ncbi:MAG: hypothetical protein SVJ22_10580 [Halobacteriota archaeon]|nr:hypothetical protein [Halobacteriota archaeon]
MEEKNEKYPEGHFIGMWMGIGIAIFSGIGVPLSIALRNPGFIGIGPAIGVAFGLALGQSIEEKYKNEGKIRPLTKEEKGKRKIAVILGIVTFLIGFVTLILIWFFQ